MPMNSHAVKPQNTQRRRLDHKQPSQGGIEARHQILQRLESQVPRVGKDQLIQSTFPGMRSVEVVGCRGTDRTLPPSQNLRQVPHLYRRMIYVDRADGSLKVELTWESLSGRPMTLLVRRGPSCRVGYTIFAQHSIETPLVPQPAPHEVTPQLPSHPPHYRSGSASIDRPADEKGEHDDLGCASNDLTGDEKGILRKIHVNMGHLAPVKLAHLLKQQGFRPGMIRAARELQCSECDACAAPKHPRPAKYHENLDFNDVIAMDGLSWRSKEGREFHLYHLIDHGTNFHAAIRTEGKDAATAILALSRMWISWAGSPGQLIVDPGTEMNSELFSEFARDHGFRCIVTSTGSQWQNGRCERHGVFSNAC